MSVSLLLALVPATSFATTPATGTCDPSVTSQYEMVDFNGKRTIWAPKLFCNQTANFTMQTGHLTVNPDGSATFTGTAKLKNGANCRHDVTTDQIWDVTYDVRAPDPGEVINEKGRNAANAGNPWQLGRVTGGLITSGDFSIELANVAANYGHQVGVGANDKDPYDLGGSFWFDYELTNTGAHPTEVRTGHGDFNFDLICKDCPTDGSLGPANGYNVYTCDDFHARGSDIAGRAFIGDTMDVAGYGIGHALNDGGTTTLEVGGDLDIHSAQIYHGDGLVEGYCTTSSLGVPDGDLVCEIDPHPLPDACDDNKLCDISNFLASQPESPTCHVDVKPWGAVRISTAGPYAVCTLDLDQVAPQILWSWNNAINGLRIHGDPGATVVINVKGANADIWGKTGEFRLQGGLDRENLIWNFGCDSAHCPSQISGVSVQGTILAPACDLQFDNGHIDGQYIVGSHSGNGQFHDVRFDGDICPPATY